MHESSNRLTRSIVVGVVATLVDLALLALMIDGLGLSKASANVPALLGGIAVQFVGNKFWAFGDTDGDVVRQGGLFALVEVMTLGLNALAFHVLAVWLGAPWLFARVVGGGAVYLGFSYPLWTRIFAPQPTKETS